MRGIEAALKVLSSETGTFASEALRKLADREKMKAQDISLASSLVYIVMRRKELWEKIAADYPTRAKLPPNVYTAVTMGIGGLLELRRFSGGVLVNGILQELKRRRDTAKYASVVNAVLHKITEGGAGLLEKFRASPSVSGRAMFAGVPVWSLPAWSRTWSRAELNELFTMMLNPSYSSLRVSPDKAEDTAKILAEQDIHYHVSDVSGAFRLNQSVLPAKIPGFTEGLFTVQSEGSILTASLVRKFYGGNGLILDMCSGRGIKAGQILQEIGGSRLECWELSENRSKSASHELERLNVSARAVLKTGDAKTLTPDEAPSFVVLDAPCSGSGTWTRKPESKWRMDWQKFDNLVMTQKKLLERAVTLCGQGGHVLYITCSLLKQENENVIAEVLAGHPECTEVSGLIDWKGDIFRKGRPYGIYILPANSWLDGFYCSMIMKR